MEMVCAEEMAREKEVADANVRKVTVVTRATNVLCNFMNRSEMKINCSALRAVMRAERIQDAPVPDQKVGIWFFVIAFGEHSLNENGNFYLFCFIRRMSCV